MPRWCEVRSPGLLPTLPALGAPATCTCTWMPPAKERHLPALGAPATCPTFSLPPATCCSWKERQFSALGSPVTSARIRGGHSQGGSIFAGEHLHFCFRQIFTFSMEVWFWPDKVETVQSYFVVAFLWQKSKVHSFFVKSIWFQLISRAKYSP